MNKLACGLLVALIFSAMSETQTRAAGQEEIDGVERAIAQRERERMHSGPSLDNLRHCIRASFPGQDGLILTNLCAPYLYVTWDDDRGEHVSAVGPHASARVGRFHGRIQIRNAIKQ